MRCLDFEEVDISVIAQSVGFEKQARELTEFANKSPDMMVTSELSVRCICVSSFISRNVLKLYLTAVFTDFMQ